MKISFDIGGVLSKHPKIFKEILTALSAVAEIHVITDMHEHSEVVEQLKDNGFGMIPSERVHCADYKKYGELCKSILVKELGIDLHCDDFAGYLQWDSQLGPAPLRLMLMPDGFKPYWHEDWKVKTDCDFGRRVSPSKLKEDT
jgi:hypothetical protein